MDMAKEIGAFLQLLLPSRSIAAADNWKYRYVNEDKF
jgi:hypothetical protein